MFAMNDVFRVSTKGWPIKILKVHLEGRKPFCY